VARALLCAEPVKTALSLAAVLVFCDCGVDFDASVVSWDARWGEEGKMDLYLPRIAHAPAVVMAHQGGWNAGDKSGLDTEANRLARAGFVVANVNYRLSPGVKFPVPAQDVACALAYLQVHADELGIDRAHIGLLGYSAGGNLSAMVGLGAVPAGDCPSGPAAPPTAVVLGAAPTDLLHLPSPGDPALVDYLGKTKDEDPQLYMAASPAMQAQPNAPPFLLVQGTADLYVPSAQAIELHTALEAAGDRVQLLLVDGGGHSLNPGSEPGSATFGDLVIDGEEAWPTVVDFLR
jgi:acetyl esterase/lipase